MTLVTLPPAVGTEVLIINGVSYASEASFDSALADLYFQLNYFLH